MYMQNIAKILKGHNSKFKYSYKVGRSYQRLLSNGVLKKNGKNNQRGIILKLRFVGVTPCLFL